MYKIFLSHENVNKQQKHCALSSDAYRLPLTSVLKYFQLGSLHNLHWLKREKPRTKLQPKEKLKEWHNARRTSNL